MNVFFVASEMEPHAATGGLGELTGKLAPALADEGLDVHCVMPMYRALVERAEKLERLDIKLSIPVGHRMYAGEVWRLKQSEHLETFFIRRDEFFDRTHLYNLPGRDYDDNAERFIFFQKAVVALIDVLGAKADIVHGHDWQTGLIPLFLNHGAGRQGRKRVEACVHTIHDVSYQGVFPGDDFALTHLPFSAFAVEVLEYYGKMSMLKAAITQSDRLLTLGAEYAIQIQSEPAGAGLAGLLHQHAHRLSSLPADAKRNLTSVSSAADLAIATYERAIRDRSTT